MSRPLLRPALGTRRTRFARWVVAPERRYAPCRIPAWLSCDMKSKGQARRHNSVLELVLAEIDSWAGPVAAQPRSRDVRRPKKLT